MGFDIGFNFPVGTAKTVDAVVDALIDEVIEPRKLAFAGSGHLAWEGMICASSSASAPTKTVPPFRPGCKARGWEAVVVTELFRSLVRRAGLISDCLPGR